MAAFVLHATSVGGFYVRLPEIQQALGISEGVYGLVLLGMPIGVLTGSLTIPRRIEVFGTHTLIAAGLVTSMLIQVVASLSVGALMLGIVQFAFGVAFSAVNVSINVEANRFEQTSGQKVMSRCHGWWALGFLAASLAAAAFVRLGVPPTWQFAGHAVLITVAVALVILPMTVSAPPETSTASARRFALPGRGVLVIGAWALAGILMEGTARGWIVIYARDTLSAAEALAALTLPAVILTQTIGRFAGDGLIARFGVVTVARASSAVLACGVMFLVLAPSVWVAIPGCLLIGAGIAINMPQAFAAAGRLTDRPTAESVAAFASLSTMINFMGPPLFGGLAETTGLRVAFAIVLPLAMVSIWRARVLEEN